ncbi:hypothetical protein SAMN05216436_1151 [bacterium A37T11]|nr:hypothetical protein SAMN05216436_1151 [bacterium A37T11]
MSKTLLKYILLIFLYKNSYAQSLEENYTSQFQELIPFTNSYLNAFSHSFLVNAGFSLNHGWTYAIDPGKFGSIRVSLVTSSALIPNSGGYLNTDQIYQKPNLEISGLVATIYGGKSTGIASFYMLDPENGSRLLNPMNGEYIKGDFELPDGLGTNIGVTPIVIPEVEVGVGLGTSVSIRFLPLSIKIDKGNASISAYGFGIKHNLLQYITSSSESGYHFNFFASYMHDKLKYVPNSGDLFEISGNYFNSQGSELTIAHQSNAIQTVISGSYTKGKFFTITAQAGASYQQSRLLSSGDLQINILIPEISSTIFSTHVPNLIHLVQSRWTPHIGAGVLVGSGAFQTSIQYAYINTHMLALGLHCQIYNVKER